MKNKWTIACLAALLLVGCEKLKEDVAEDIVIKAMTDGQWKVVSFTRDGTDASAGFAPYRFQFRADRTVEAINSGTVENTGTWDANATSRTIRSQFNNPAPTLALLNGQWTITRNGWTYVEATLSINAENRSLRLEKQ